MKKERKCKYYKYSHLIIAVIIGIVFTGLAYPRAMVCLLEGQQETPSRVSSGMGSGIFSLDTVAHTLTYHISFSGLTTAENAAHIHGPAIPGVSAGVLFPLPTGSVKTGVWNMTLSEESTVLEGLTYVNIHTNAFSGGEIRGQIVDMVATLNGAQEVPSKSSPAEGFGAFIINTTARTLSYYIAYSGFTSPVTAGHIHGYALQTANAGVLLPLTTAAINTGVWNYSATDEPNILMGLTYVNFHTSVNPGGEIRGQITRMVTPIDGEREVPPVSSTAAGIGLFAIDTNAKVLSYHITYTGLTTAETAAHIHGYANETETAGVLLPLSLGTPKLGAWSYPAADESLILGNQTYTNIHSTTFPGGEIRGQIEPNIFPPVVVTNPPVYSGVPDVKVWNTRALTTTFNLETYNTSDPATTWSIITNENSVATLTGSVPTYPALTLGSDPPSLVVFQAENAGGVGDASQKVKHSAYLFARLPAQGIIPGKDVTVSLADKVFDSTDAPVVPASFANSSAVRVVSAGSGLTASIDSTGTILNISGATAPIADGDIVISASPLSTAPFASNYDNGIVRVHPVLNAFSEFSAASDTTHWFFELPATGASAQPPLSWNTNYGGQSGVVQFSCVSGTAQGVKISVTAGISATDSTWYAIRAWILSNLTPVTSSENVANMNIFATDTIAGGTRFGRAFLNAKSFGGNVWEQVDAHVQTFSGNCMISPQLVMKNVSQAANLYVDAIEIFKQQPRIELALVINSIPVPNGSFDSGTTGWFLGTPQGVTVMPTVTVEAAAPGGQTNALKLAFSGTGQGLKLSYVGTPITIIAKEAIKQSVKVYSAVSNGSRSMSNILFVTDTATDAVVGSQAGINNGAGFTTGTWQTVEASALVDNPNAGSVTPQIVVKNGNGVNAASDVVYLDDIQISQDGDRLHFFRFDPALMP